MAAPLGTSSLFVGSCAVGFPWGTRVRVHPPTGLRGGGVVLVGCIIWSKVLVSEAAGPLGVGGGVGGSSFVLQRLTKPVSLSKAKLRLVETLAR